jgi:hypothetical protein
MDNRPVVKVKAECYWYCPECNARNEETSIPDTSDLTCQSCGTNYKNGSEIVADDEFKKLAANQRMFLSELIVHCGHRTTKLNGHGIPYGVCCHDDHLGDREFACALPKCPLLQ